jgi:hypothetical protein
MPRILKTPPIFVVICLSFATALASEEQSPYRPSEHPAGSERTITGFTKPAAKLIISAEDSAKLLSLPFAVGTTLGEGDTGDPTTPWITVGQLDDGIARTRLDSAKAQVNEAAARVTQINAEIARNQREVTWWQIELKRFSTLAEEGRSSQRQVDETAFRRDQSELAGKALQQQLLSAEASLGVAKANHAQQRLIVQRHQLRAPRGWVVVARHLEPSSLANPGQGIIELADTRTLEVELRLSSQEVTIIQAANAAKQLSLGHNGKNIPATLHAVSPDFDAESRKHAVYLRFPGEAVDNARGGLSVSLAIPLPDPNGGVLIPLSYTRAELDQWLVYSSDGDALRIKPIRLEGDALVVDPDSLPTNLEIIPHPAQTSTENGENAEKAVEE